MSFQNKDIIIDNGNTPDLQKKRNDILKLLSKCIQSVDPYKVVQSHITENRIILPSETISLSDFSNIYVASFGKASVGMIKALTDEISITKGVVITHIPNTNISIDNIKIFKGNHPIPDQCSIDGTKAIEHMISEVKENDLLLILISGGGSALLCHPHNSLEDMQKTTMQLLKSGATIQEVNTVRKHLSHVKGGQLIKNAKGKVISFIISDVINDPLSFISSGPTVGDETTFSDAYEIFKKYNLWETIPLSTKEIIEKGLKEEIPETPNEANPIFNRVTNVIIANNTLACESVYLEAKKLGYSPFVFSTTIQGESKEMANTIINKFISYKKQETCNLFITGGETTVIVKGNGKGGRNQEMVLASLPLLEKHNLVFASFGTDGIDGMSNAAGAIADRNSLKKAKKQNLDSEKYLNDNNSNMFFEKLNDLIITGPTGTNVMDIQIIIS